MKGSLLSEQQKLLALLSPIQEETRSFAWRVTGSQADGDDLFQEAVIHAIKKFSALRDENKFRVWFYRILISRHRSNQRRSFWKRFVPMSASQDSQEHLSKHNNFSLEEERTQTARAQKALATLPQVQREAVILFELQGYSLEEITEIQHASLSAVKSRLTRGRERLKRFYEKLGFGPKSKEQLVSIKNSKDTKQKKETQNEYAKASL